MIIKILNLEGGGKAKPHINCVYYPLNDWLALYDSAGPIDTDKQEELKLTYVEGSLRILSKLYVNV